MFKLWLEHLAATVDVRATQGKCTLKWFKQDDEYIMRKHAIVLQRQSGYMTCDLKMSVTFSAVGGILNSFRYSMS